MAGILASAMYWAIRMTLCSALWLDAEQLPHQVAGGSQWCSCRPHYLPRQFSYILFVAIYLPPQTDAGTKTIINELYKAKSKQENAHSVAALLVTGDFNTGKVKFLPTCHMCNQRKKTLDYLYSTHRDAYKALLCPPFSKSDHNSILLILACKQKLKQDVQVTRSIRKWSDDADATLQDCFDRLENVPGFTPWH